MLQAELIPKSYDMEEVFKSATVTKQKRNFLSGTR